MQKTLDEVHADASLRNQALQPLQQIKATVAALSSIPKIRYLKEQAGNMLDSAMDAISLASKPTATVVSAPGDTATVLTTGNVKPTVTAKPTKVVRAADVAVQSYLETESDVDEYLARLKKQILAEINAGGKVRIQ